MLESWKIFPHKLEKLPAYLEDAAPEKDGNNL